jgi:hypothetical protein
MANPLTLYVPIKQHDEAVQTLAKLAYATFVNAVKPGLDHLEIVHYARLALIPHQDPKAEHNPPVEAILLMTEFDGSMDTYLKAFWDDSEGIKKAFTGLMMLAANPVKGFDPKHITYDQFSHFITSNNISKPSDNYSAYPDTVISIRG